MVECIQCYYLTTTNFKTMDELFNQLWAILYDHGASAKKEEGTRRYWATLTPQEQRQVFTTISTKIKEDKFVQYDPIRAIKENLRRVRSMALSFDAYYDKFHTTEEREGWKMVKPKKQGDPPVHYVLIG